MTAILRLAGALAPLVLIGAAPVGSLVLDVSNVRNARGAVHADLCGEAQFLKDTCRYSADAPAHAGVTTVGLDGIPPGRYAVQAFHDENRNHKVDRVLFGIPKEGVGFSRDAPIRMSPPKWEDARFDFAGGRQTIGFRMRYMLGASGPDALMPRVIPPLVGASTAQPWRTVLFCLLLAAIGGAFVATHFRMTTDTADLISPEVDWRRHERAMDAAFPQFNDVMLVVVDGATPELAEEAAARLTARMSQDPAHFHTVRRPDGGAFFAREGLLFGSQTEVRSTADALIRAQPLLGPLAADPSLRGVAGALATMVDGVDRGSATFADAAPAMRGMAQAVDARLAGNLPSSRGSDCSRAPAARRPHADSSWSRRCSTIPR